MTRKAFQPAVYLMASKPNGTLYTGVTADLVQRVWQHREDLLKASPSDTVWYELHAAMEHAIAREKQINAGPRKRK